MASMDVSSREEELTLQLASSSQLPDMVMVLRVPIFVRMVTSGRLLRVRTTTTARDVSILTQASIHKLMELVTTDFPFVLFVAHEQEEIMSLCKYGLVFDPALCFAAWRAGRWMRRRRHERI